MKMKFRAIINNNTIYFTLGILAHPNPPRVVRKLLIPWLLDGNEPDLCTPVKDKDNHREIYEGDIVKFTDFKDVERVGQVNYAFGVEYADPAAYLGKHNIFLNKKGTFEVLGNIHETPELI